MNGAEIILKTAKDAGIEICFANAGTTELPIVAAFDSIRGIRPVLGLFEGVCTGAADGYGRMKQKPAMNLLHMGPGLANGIANLHNARRARTPVFNIIGDHASWHLSADAPLTMDIASIARTVSGWQRHSSSVKTLARDTVDAIEASLIGQISTLILPSDHQWSESNDVEISIPKFNFESIDLKIIEEAAKLIRKSRRPALILGGRALRKAGLDAVARIKAKTGCDLFMVTFPAYADRGAGLPALTRIPYFPKHARNMLSEYDAFVMVGTNEPVAFFGYKGGSSFYLSDEQKKLRIDTDRQDTCSALLSLAEELDAPTFSGVISPFLAEYKLPEIPFGELNPEKMCAIIAALQPENCIMVEEGLMSAAKYHSFAANIKPHSYITITGGAIGQGMPCSLGAALACPDRQVINIEADGSAMYTLQALWTQARENTDVITLICSNRKYSTLEYEYLQAGYRKLGNNFLSLIQLDNPKIDWVGISRGMNIPAVSVNTSQELVSEMELALGEPGPHLIEVILNG